MSFLARLGKFFIIIFLLCSSGYFIMFNGSPIDVSFGHFGGVSVPAAVAYIACFFAGAAVVTAFFGYEFTKTNFKLKQARRKLRRLESVHSTETRVAGGTTSLGTTAHSETFR